MANWAGVSASLVAIVRPSILQPRLSVPSIAQLDWARLRDDGGITGVVVDKDNCIAKPSEDDLAPDAALRESWKELLETFGAENVLVVSNSAGTLAKDPLLLQAESVSRNLRVPVLVHKAPKPGPACVRQVAAHFLLPQQTAPLPSSLALPSTPSTTPASQALKGQVVFSPLARSAASPSPPSASPSRPPRLLVIGDRLATDMILSHRISRLPLPLTLPSSAPAPPRSRAQGLLALFRRARLTHLGRSGERIETVAVLTTKLHAREGLGTTLLRAVEKTALWGLQRAKRRRVRGPTVRGTEKEYAEGRGVEEVDWEDFVIRPAATLPAPAALPAAVVDSVKPAMPVPLSPSSSQTPPSPSAPSPPLVERLRAFPQTASTTLAALPQRTSLYLSALPSRLPSALLQALRRLSLRAQRSLPALLSRLHAPLSRLIAIYTSPSSLAPPPSFAVPRGKRKSVAEMVEPALDRAEGAWERVSGGVRGVRALAEARAEELARLREGIVGKRVDGKKEGAKA
ncbi:hypothetical protein JCM10213_002665 [Rhodosporidiobolus nylandii]